MTTISAGPLTRRSSDEQVAPFAAASDDAATWRRHGRFDREQPAHTLSVPEVLLANYPVTVGEYRPFIEAAGDATDRFWIVAGCNGSVAVSRTAPDGWNRSPWTDDDRLPVVGVPWFEAVGFWNREAPSSIARFVFQARPNGRRWHEDPMVGSLPHALDSRRCSTRTRPEAADSRRRGSRFRRFLPWNLGADRQRLGVSSVAIRDASPMIAGAVSRI